MKTIYHIRTSAYDALLAVDYESRTACYVTENDCNICPPADVEDVNTWRDIDYDEAVAGYVNGGYAEIEILDTAEVDV